jgi:hypothetical protein
MGMSRIVRQFLVTSLVTLHTAIILCGPCFHALPGSGHDSGYTTHDPSKAPHDSADNCPICHFMTQGQLPVESSFGLSARLIGELVPNLSPAACPASFHHVSSPRAPPVAVANLS